MIEDFSQYDFSLLHKRLSVVFQPLVLRSVARSALVLVVGGSSIFITIGLYAAPKVGLLPAFN